MDDVNELGKILGDILHHTDHVLNRDFKDHSLIDRSRDILDSSIPMEFVFYVPDRTGRHPVIGKLDLIFLPSTPAQGCAGSFCGQCDTYIGPTETALITSHIYLTDRVRVFKNTVRTTDFSETGPREITLGFLPLTTDIIKVCYLWTP